MTDAVLCFMYYILASLSSVLFVRLKHSASVTNNITVPAGVWMAPRATGEKPPPLYGHTFTKVDRCRAVVFGGIPQDLKHCGTYVLDMNRWVRKCVWLCGCHVC